MSTMPQLPSGWPPFPKGFDASGVFETCRIKGGVVLHLEEHLKRLRASLKTLGIPWRKEKVWRVKIDSAARDLQSGSIRVAVRRWGVPSVILHKQPTIPYSEEILSHGVTLRTSPTRWPGGDSAVARVKGSERLGSIFAKLEGGASFEALRFGSHGFLTEGTVSNFFLMKENVLITPPVWLGVLEGVTRAQVLDVAKRLTVPVREIPLTRHDLFNADEAFLTNVLMGICPIQEVDGRLIGSDIPGPLTLKFIKALQ